MFVSTHENAFDGLYFIRAPLRVWLTDGPHTTHKIYTQNTLHTLGCQKLIKQNLDKEKSIPIFNKC